MTNRFKHKDPIGKIMVGFISILVLAFIILLFMPVPMGDDYHKMLEEKVALNFAASVAQDVGTYYTETDSTGFIGLSTGYDEDFLFINDSLKISAPKAYKCEITDSLVVVTHIDGAQAEVRWR